MSNGYTAYGLYCKMYGQGGPLWGELSPGSKAEWDRAVAGIRTVDPEAEPDLTPEPPAENLPEAMEVEAPPDPPEEPAE